MQEKFQIIVDFIREVYNQPDGLIPLHAPHFGGNERKYLIECIDSTFVSSVGKYVNKIEQMIAEYTGAKRAIAIVNGTNALHLALLVAGVKPGDEVITQSLTFIATANALTYTGAEAVFIDVDKDTLGLSPASLAEWLESSTFQRFNKSNNQQETINIITGKRISAIIPMHTFGHPCRIDDIVEIGTKYNIPVVEDAAESLGSFYKGRHTGTFGKLGILSFNGNKTITTGGGGMILCNDDELGTHIKHLTTQAKVSHPWEFVHDHIAYNYRLPNINAALGVAQMEQLVSFIENKRRISGLYKEFFERIGIDFFVEPENSRSNYWLNTIVLEDKDQRDLFLKFTNEKEIMSRPAWTLMNKLVMFDKCQRTGLDNAEYLADRIVNIPSSIIT